MKFWGNLIGYQLGWFATVIAAGHGMAWPGVLAALVFVAWQLAVSDDAGADLRLVVTALVLGVVVDGAASAFGWLAYAAATPALPPGGAPIWILGLWASFAMTLNRTLAYLRARPWLSLIFGGIGAPLAYLGAARGWQAVTFAPPAWHAVVWLGIGWAVAMPVLTQVAARLHRSAALTHAEAP